MTEIKDIRIHDYDYPLPEERIATHPLQQRDACKLLVANAHGSVIHGRFSELPMFVKADTLIVANETRVIRARIEFIKETGAKIEIFLLEPFSPADYAENFASCNGCSWICLVGNKKRWKDGSIDKEVIVGEGKTKKILRLCAEMISEHEGNGVEIRFSWDDSTCSFAEIVEAAGRIPIPPYLKRDTEESDSADYQTVYSKTEGSVAAPTAGLHFTPELIDRLKRHGDEFITVTLHVGAGTFQPVKSEDIGSHPMHSEWISVPKKSLWRIIEALEAGRSVLAVGTTSVRTLESLPYLGSLVEKARLEGKLNPELRVSQWMPYDDRFKHIDTIRSLRSLLVYLEEKGLACLEADTSIMIAPGFRWRIVDRLITNFHQPKSTLLLLVSSFLGKDIVGKEKWRKLYECALEKEYRFLSYGDACLFSRGPQSVELPLAKSMVLRAATLYAERSPEKLDELLESGLCDDSELYISALKKVLESTSGCNKDIYIGEGAAPLRFLTAYAASLPQADITVTCARGLQKRPISPLITALIDMGADIRFSDGKDDKDWKLEIHGKKLKGNCVSVDSSFTSQFLSALLLASPLWENGWPADCNRESLVSKPYLRMTEEMLLQEDPIAEPDWSAAAFFFEQVMISGKSVDIEKLIPPSISLQGDSAACDVYGAAGVNIVFHKEGGVTLRFDSQALCLAKEKGVFEFDFSDYPDMVPSVAVAFCYRRLPFVFHGIEHLRYKECDRLAALQTLLLKIGYDIKIEEEMLVFSGGFSPLVEFPVEIETYGDHRIAMAFYPLERTGMVTIEDKSVVSKSFPNFYQQF